MIDLPRKAQENMLSKVMYLKLDNFEGSLLSYALQQKKFKPSLHCAVSGIFEVTKRDLKAVCFVSFSLCLCIWRGKVYGMHIS